MNLLIEYKRFIWMLLQILTSKWITFQKGKLWPHLHFQVWCNGLICRICINKWKYVTSFFEDYKTVSLQNHIDFSKSSTISVHSILKGISINISCVREWGNWWSIWSRIFSSLSVSLSHKTKVSFYQSFFIKNFTRRFTKVSLEKFTSFPK